MASLFSMPDLKNKPSRNGFDLSHKTAFTAKVGELLPLWHRTVMPGDKFTINREHVTRTMPVETAAFTRIKEYYDYFFVPYKQLYKLAPEVLTQMKTNPTQASNSTSSKLVSNNLPWMYMSDLYGFTGVLHKQGKGSEQGKLITNFSGMQECYMTAKLLNHLGYSYCSPKWVNNVSNALGSYTDQPYYDNIPVSILPLAGYQKIYFDHFRFDRWEINKPFCYNFDYMVNSCQFTIPEKNDYYYRDGLFTMRYANYSKDLFFGMLPSPQIEATATTSDAINGEVKVNSNVIYIQGQYPGDVTNMEFTLRDNNTDWSKLKSHVDILNLRQAQALQRYREITGTGNQDYKSMLEKLYGVQLPQIANNTCTYLGGFQSNLNIQEVTNSNLVESAATIQGKGYGQSSPNQPINFEAKEHGLIMCIYHAVPMIDYELSAYHFDVTKTEVDDFANPVFDKIGMQELPSYYLDANYQLSSTPTLGYVPRYFDYKTSLDSIQGAFRSTMPNWLAPINNSYLKFFVKWDPVSQSFINYNFFKVNPHLLDPIFYNVADSSVDSDQLLVNCEHTVKAVRNLDFKGLPY